MISLYPLLVSNTISKNIVPGVCKVLENYIMVYGLADLLKRTRGDLGGEFQIRSNKVIRKEDIEEHLPGFLYREIIAEASNIYNIAGAGTKTFPDPVDPLEQRKKDVEIRKKELEIDRLKQRDVGVKLDTYNTQTISLEPTWMKIDQIDRNGNKVSGVIGVKVVPYAVKSDANLSQLLMYDNQVNKLQRLAILTGRKITNMLYRIWMSAWTKIPFVSKSTAVTGDPRKDILLKRNILSVKGVQNIFVLANQAELSDTFYASAKGMINLQKMGWGSIVIADDVNRRVAFCMRELNGLCSLLPYTMLYQTFSQAKVYEDIEDAKRNASSIFKMRREKMSKLIGEGVSQSKVEEFSFQNLPLIENELINEMTLIDENIGGFIKSITPAKIKASLMGKNIGIPATTNQKVLKLGMKLHPEFKKGYDLTYKVLSNSEPDVSKKMIELASLFIAVKSSLSKTSNYMMSVKTHIKTFIKMFRKITRSKTDTPNMPKAHYVDAAFGWVVIIGSIVTLKMLFPISGTIQKISQWWIDNWTAIPGKAYDFVKPIVVNDMTKEWASSAVETVQSVASDFLSTVAPGAALLLLILYLIRK